MGHFDERCWRGFLGVILCSGSGWRRDFSSLGQFICCFYIWMACSLHGSVCVVYHRLVWRVTQSGISLFSRILFNDQGLIFFIFSSNSWWCNLIGFIRWITHKMYQKLTARVLPLSPQAPKCTIEISEYIFFFNQCTIPCIVVNSSSYFC